MTSAPSSEEERPTFNRQVDGSTPSERTNRERWDAHFMEKIENHRYAKAAAVAWRRTALRYIEELNDALARIAELETK